MIAQKNNEKTYFYCYSTKLRRHIRNNGVRWIDKGVNENSGFPYWIFEKTEGLGEILKKYET